VAPRQFERNTLPVSGHLQLRGPKGSRRWHALWRDDDGRHHQILGPAHAKDSGRRTARGAVVWRAADGPKPSASHLTPDEARQALDLILARARLAPPRVELVAMHTLGKARPRAREDAERQTNGRSHGPDSTRRAGRSLTAR